MQRAARVRWALVLAVLAGAIATGTSVATASGGGVTLTVQAQTQAGFNAIDWTRRFELSGVLGTRKAGVTVTLQADPFPFHGFVTAATTRSAGGGSYAFRLHEKVATRYRVTAGTAQSPTATVYALEHEVRLSCNLCGKFTGGTHIVVTEVYSTPAALVSEHLERRAFVYFKAVAGTRPPTTLDLLRSVHQRSAGYEKVTFSYTINFKAPVASGAYRWNTEGCFQDHETADGMGLPGHHGCGGRTINYLNYVG